VTMGYWTAPPEALESAALMAPWARLALQAALSAHQAAIRPPRGRLRAGAQATRKAAPTTRGRPRG
jgi:DNA transformation protein